MAYLTETYVRRRAQGRANRKGMSVRSALKVESRLDRTRYDIFLSQTIKDEELVLGVYAILTEDLSLTVFCDWIEAPETDRANVTPENARYIREKMKLSETLLFLDSESADQSKWMCWELGWFDAAKGRVGVLPVVLSASTPYRGREFLGLYPLVSYEEIRGFTVSRPPRTILETYNRTESMPFSQWRRAAAGTLQP